MKCKLTDANDQTRGGLQWGPGVTHTVKWGGVLCEAGALHYYDHPLLAGFFDPIHATFGDTAHLWSIEVSGRTVSDGTKSGAETLTTVERIDLPVLTTEQRVELAIRLTLHVYSEPGYVAWARAWIDGSDRSVESAAEAAESAATKWATSPSEFLGWVLAEAEEALR